MLPVLGAAVATVLSVAACTASSTDQPADGAPAGGSFPHETVQPSPSGEFTIAFAGDVHFEGRLERLVRRPRGGLGPVTRILRGADVAMVNLETALTERGRPAPKELERAVDRYHFRAPARALDVLAAAGVDVVSAANNHVGDYGEVGLRDTLAAARRSDVAVVGIGRNEGEAFAPHRVRVGDLDVALLAADTVQREGSSGVWAAGPGSAGSAAARGAGSDRLVAAVRDAGERDDLVVVYLHWGREQQACPTQSQRRLGRDLAEAGADVVVGSHTHVLGGAGWSGDTYVSYGLGNFAWYHARQPDTGVLTLRLDADGVVEESVETAWTPARIGDDGLPRPLTGSDRTAATADWRSGRRCTGLAAERGEPQAADPTYDASVRRIDDELAARMRTSHRPGCPVPLRDLRYVEVTHRGFDGAARTGELVVHRRWAADVVEVFGRLYDAGWPIEKMRLVDDYGGDDDASMGDNNTSGFNCRRVAGQRAWSAHAYGAAIDLNPLQNPYVTAGSVDPPAGRRFARVDRARSAPVPLGVIRSGDLPVTAFARIGWEWGGDWVASKDWQHVAAPDPGRGRMR